MRIFVAGATGVIGRRTVDQLIAAGHDVTAVARTEEKAARLWDQGARPVMVDLFDADAVDRAVQGHEAVVNLATHIPPASRAAFRRAWRENNRLRTEASRHLAGAAAHAGAEVLVQESISLLYADGGDDWLGEGAPVVPTVFTRSAVEAERQARAFSATAPGGRAVVLRFAQFVAPESGHIQQLLGLARRGILPLVGDPEGYESCIDADDAARAVVAALDCPSGTYNVAEDAPMTRQEHAAVFAEALGRPVRLPPGWLGRIPRLDHVARSRRVANRTLRDATGWAPVHGNMTSVWPSLLRSVGQEAHA
jgi:nucleoside-diphosphate-sugar epimerase